jgi:hypothetical protein
MPNHVHFLARFFEKTDLSEFLHNLKGATSRAINLELGRTGRLWAREYHDRFMRTNAQFEHTLGYIHANPVKAGICIEAGDHPFSSARHLLKPDEEGCLELTWKPLEALHEKEKLKWEAFQAECLERRIAKRTMLAG